MITSSTYYPLLSDLVDARTIPGDIKKLEQLANQGIGFLLGNLRYRDLLIERSTDGDTAFYSVTVLSKELKLPLFAGLNLVFFPGETLHFSEFPIAFDWRWPIIKYFSEFDIRGFSYAPEAFADVLLELVEIENETVFFEILIELFLNDGVVAYQALYTEINASYTALKADWPSIELQIDNILSQLTAIKNEVDAQLALPNVSLLDIAKGYKSNTILKSAVDSAVASFKAINETADVDFDIYKTFIKAVLKDIQDIEQKFEQLLDLFANWLGQIDKHDIEDLLIPQFEIELQQVSLALEFPRNWIAPVDNNTLEIIPADTSGNPQSLLTFDVGSLKYSTQTGFHFVGENNFNFTQSMIGRTGLTLEITQMKLDLSRKTNIAEAIADDRPVDFMGVYVKQAVITLPKKWFKQESNATLGIIADNLLIGTGGFTARIALQAVATEVAKLSALINLQDNTLIEFILQDQQTGEVKIGDKVVYQSTQNSLPNGTHVLVNGDTITVNNEKLRSYLPANTELTTTLGKRDPAGGTRKGFKIGFSYFHMLWQQNALIESSVKGSLTIPKFKRCDNAGNAISGAVTIDIEAFFEQDGDFQITAKANAGLSFCLEKVFIVTVDGLEVGKDDGRVFLCISGNLSFENNNILSSLLKDPIEVKNLCIYSDGSFEIAGGSVPLPDSAKLKLGLNEVYITNLTFGSEERQHKSNLRKYKYFGFDCALGVGNAGLDLRGDGIAFYFTADNDQFGGEPAAHRFMKIEGIGIDLIIPANASKKSASVLIQGYLSLKQEEYLGSVAIAIPKIKLTGGAAMKMKPKENAWIVDAFVDLSAGIPLAASGLSIYGFRGLFGYKYIAAKQAIGLTGDDSWFDYYKKDVQPGGKGVHIGKMYTPDDNKETVSHASNPMSIGAGITIATNNDDGKAFSLQAFLLISLPELIFIQGKANVLGERVGLIEGEPPFFAFVAFSPGHSVEFGLGADFKKDVDGKLLDIHAEVKAGFFMKNSSAWYVNFGTKNAPINARILSLFDAYSYLMLSAGGIEAGAGVSFAFKKKYGPLKIDVGVYLDIWGTLSFERVQIGAGIALGGHVDIAIWGIGFYIGIATILEATVPKPFRIAGSVEVCVSIKVLFKKFKKCVNVEFTWLKDANSNVTPIAPLFLGGDAALINNNMPSPVSAVHLGSGKTYKINYFGNTLQANDQKINTVIPLDSVIDIQFEKALNANAVSDKIGGVSNAPSGHVDVIPPKPAYKQVTHAYRVNSVKLMVWSGGSWVNYHPYEALTVGSVSSNPVIDLSALKLGYFQKSGNEYNKIRLLAQTPFSYMETSTGDYIPEQMGINSAQLFCKESKRQWQCVHWQELKTYANKPWYHHQGLNLTIKHQAEANEVIDAQVVDFANVFIIPQSLKVDSTSSIEITLPKDCQAIKLKLSSFAYGVTVFYLTANRENGFVEYLQLSKSNIKSHDLVNEIFYKNNKRPIAKIIIIPSATDPESIHKTEVEIDRIQQLIYLGGDSVDNYINQIQSQRKKLKQQLSIACTINPENNGTLANLKAELKKVNNLIKKCEKRLSDDLDQMLDTACKECAAFEAQLNNCLVNILPEIPTHEGQTGRLGCLKNMLQVLKKQRVKNKKLIAYLSQFITDTENCHNKIKPQLLPLQKELSKVTHECHKRCELTRERIKQQRQFCDTLQGKKQQLLLLIEQANNHPPLNGMDQCGTYIHEICWMTQEDYEFNQTIPAQAAIEADHQLTKSGLENTIAPILRPNAKYLIKMELSDTVNGNTTNNNTIYFGFETKGPIGHFPEENIVELDKFKGNDSGSSPFDQKVEVPETALKFYLDNDKSYPDPRGKLINAKPLYYQDPKILLFYTKPYVYHFFGKWDAYQGLPTINGQLEMLIKDPVADSADPAASDHTATVFSLFPETVVSWHDDNDPIVAEDVKIYSALRNPEINNPNFSGGHCWVSGGDPIVPASKGTKIIAKHLRPSKLYTAILKNKFQGSSIEVHRFGFQTSVFASFEQHINAYHLQDKNSNNRDAIFNLDLDLNLHNVSIQTNLNRAFNIIVNEPANLSTYNNKLAKTYTDPYQRLMQGHFELAPQHPPANGLEFNFLREKTTGKFIAILINSVEPLNDPKIHFTYLRESVKVLENGVIRSDYFPLFAKDRSKIVLMNLNKNIDMSVVNDLRIQLVYIQWDGYKYQQNTVITTDNLIL